MILAQSGYVPALTPADPGPEARMLELVRRRPGFSFLGQRGTHCVYPPCPLSLIA